MLSTRPTCHGSPVCPVFPCRGCPCLWSVGSVVPDGRTIGSADRFDLVWSSGIFDLSRADTMTRRSHGAWYVRPRLTLIDARPTGRVAAVRVRTFELRLIALVLAGCWTAAAATRAGRLSTGRPDRRRVGLAALLPAIVALVGVAWPPVARGDRAFAGMVSLAAGIAPRARPVDRRHDRPARGARRADAPARRSRPRIRGSSGSSARACSRASVSPVDGSARRRCVGGG